MRSIVGSCAAGCNLTALLCRICNVHANVIRVDEFLIARGRTWMEFLGGTRGDAFDQGVNFASGFGDNLTLGMSAWFHHNNPFLGDHVDYEGTSYFLGDMAANFVLGPTSIANKGTLVWKLYNQYDDAGRCASIATKLIQGGCFVAGTPVTISNTRTGIVFGADFVRPLRIFLSRRSIVRVGIWRRGLFCRFRLGKERFWAAMPWFSRGDLGPSAQRVVRREGKRGFSSGCRVRRCSLAA